MERFFLTIVEITAGMAVLILLLLPLLATYGKRFTARCRYILWLLVLVRLAIPISVGFLPAIIEVPLGSETELSMWDEEVQEYTQYVPVKTVPESHIEETDMGKDMDKTPVAEPVAVVPDTVQRAEKTFDLQRILAVVRIVYFAGAAVFLLWNLISYRLYTAWLLRSSTVPDEHTQAIYEKICKKHSVQNAPNLCISHSTASPAAFGLFQRIIVLPDIFFTDNELAGTLSHEVVHCKRGDLWVKLLALVARSLHWFNPLAHIAALRCEMEMELSCDEAVLVGCDEEARAAYGEGMLDIVRRCRQKDARHSGALTTHFRPRKNAVKARFANILYGTGKKKGYWLMAVCIVLCLVAGTAVACQTDGGESLSDRDEDVLWTYGLTGEDGLRYIQKGGKYTLQGTYASGEIYDIVDFSLDLLTWGAEDRLGEVLPMGHRTSADTFQFYFRYCIQQGYFYEITLTRGERLTYDSIREITTEEAVELGVFCEDMVEVTSLDALQQYADAGVLSTQMVQFYWDLLSGESEIEEWNTVQIEDYTISFTVPMTEYSTYIRFTVTESGLETLPVGRYSWQVEDIRDVTIVNRRSITAQEKSYYEDETVQKLIQFFYANYCYNTPTYGEPVPHPAIHNYICNYYGNGEVTSETFTEVALEEFGITDLSSFDLEVWRTEGNMIQAGGLGGGICMQVVDVEQRTDKKIITVQFYADGNELLLSHKIAYHFDANGEHWLGYEVLTKAKREPWGMQYCSYGTEGTDRSLWTETEDILQNEGGKTMNGSSMLTTILSDLQKDDAKAYLSHGTEDTKYPAFGLESGYHYETEMEDYTFTAVEKLDNPKGDEYVLYSDPVGTWEVHGWYDSNHVMLVYEDTTYYFEAKHPSAGKFGKVLKWWFDLAEYEAAPYQNVFTEESYLEAAQAFADSYFGRRLHLTSGSRYALSYVSCTVTGVDAEYKATLIEGGLIPENAYPYFLTVVFTYENPFGEADGVAEPYTGDDPNVPQNAYQMRWCCYLTKEEDGWHARPGGTGW